MVRNEAHLCIEPGDQLNIELLPDGRGLIHAVRRHGAIEGFIGLLAGKTYQVATIEEISEAAAEGWSGQR